MKKARILNVISLILNLAIIGLVSYAIFGLIGNSLLAQFPRLDILAGGLMAIFALICLIFNFIAIAKGQKLGKVAYAFKLIGTSTSISVLLFSTIYLAMNNSWDIASQLGGFSFSNASFFLVFIVPLLSLIAFLFFDQSEKAKFPVNFLSVIPVLAYFGFYIINHSTQLLDVDYNYDWYNLFGTNDDTVHALIVIVIAILVTFVISVVLWLINGLLNKVYFKEVADQQQPVKEEKEETAQEEVKEEVAPQEENKEEVVPEVKEEPKEEEKEEIVDPVEVQDEYFEEETEIKEEAPVEENKPAAKKASNKKPAEKKSAAKKAAPKAKEKEAPVKAKVEKETPTANNGTKVYHLTKRKEDGMWAITFVGGQKAVKLFKTKKEAEAALEVLTKNQGATALIRNSKGAKAGKFASSIKSDKED